MDPHSILIVSPPDYPHSQVFDEVALALHEAFKELGTDAPIARDPRQILGRPIVLGANLIPGMPVFPLPADAVLFNLEQVPQGSAWITPQYLDLLRRFEVWDYSTDNIAALRAHGVANIHLCELGYADSLTRIKKTREDIPILFYGSVNDRRQRIFDALKADGVEIVHAFNVYGAERDALIARAKIILNVHFYADKVFEIVRVMYLLANQKFVISESGLDHALEQPFVGGMIFAPYDGLVEQCRNFLKRKENREYIAKKGFNLVKQRRQSEFLRKALDSSRVCRE